VIESDAAGIASANERNERFRERRCGDGGGHVVGKRKKRVIQSDAAGIAASTSSPGERNDRYQRAALWGWQRACRQQAKETSDSERRGGHRGGHIVGKRKNRAIPGAALW
jgi:hypothetical protein